MDSTKTYKVLGEEGAEVTITGIETPVAVGSTVELTDAQAESALAEGKVELVESNDGGNE